MYATGHQYWIQGRIRTLVSSWVLEIEGANPLNEGLHASLLKDAHERGLESFASIRGYLGNSGFVGSTLLNVAAGDLLELEISGNISGDENVGQLSRGHEELGNKVNVPVVESAVFRPRLLASLKVSILLEELCVMYTVRDESFRGGGSK